MIVFKSVNIDNVLIILLYKFVFITSRLNIIQNLKKKNEPNYENSV